MSRRRMLMAIPPKGSGKPINRIRLISKPYYNSYILHAVAEFPITSPMLQVWFKGNSVSMIYEGETQGSEFSSVTESVEFVGFQLDWGDMETLTKEDENYIYVYEG